MEIRHFCGALFVVCLCGNGMSFPADHKQQHSSCETKETVLEGDRATISCRFSRLFQNFLVYKLPSSDGSHKTIPVVCKWEKGKQNCNILDGYHVTTTETRDRATVAIPLAQQGHSGQYYCKTLPASNDNATGCMLTVQKNTVRRQHLVVCNASRPVAIGEEASLVCEFSKSFGSTGITLTKHGLNQVEIMRCNKNRQCEIQTKGYAVAEQTDTYVRISIPSATYDHTGDYECSSAIIKDISGRCSLELTTGPLDISSNTNGKESPPASFILGTIGIVMSTVALAVITIIGILIYRNYACGCLSGVLNDTKAHKKDINSVSCKAVNVPLVGQHE